MSSFKILTASITILALNSSLQPTVAKAQYYQRCGACGDVGCARCQPPGQPEMGEVPERGAFIAPQPTGEVQGESSSIGLRLGSFRIPSITIEMPTCQLPSLVKYRRDARMLTESGVAPYYTRGVAEFDVRPGEPESAPEAGEKPELSEEYFQPGCCPLPGCTSQNSEQRIKELEAQIAQLNLSLKQLAEIQLKQMQKQQQLNGSVRQTSVQEPPAPPAPEVRDYSIFSESQRRRLEHPNVFDLPVRDRAYGTDNYEEYTPHPLSNSVPPQPVVHSQYRTVPKKPEYGRAQYQPRDQTIAQRRLIRGY